jgi:1,6-anhydro-N-acetylmuramate kinase
VADRSRRLALGLALEDDLATVTGSLVVSEGKGKYLRIIRAVTGFRGLSKTTSHLLRQLSEGCETNPFDLRAVQSDVATAQAAITEELLAHAGKYVDRVLFIAIADPGLHLQEDDSHQIYLPIADPELLAEATGISVIDAFPLRDISAGGSGQGLLAFPAWLLFADRSPRTACRDRWLFVLGERTEAYFLPASDGLDAEIPAIEMFTGPGLETIRPLMEHQPGSCHDTELQQTKIVGHSNEELAHAYQHGSTEALTPAINLEKASNPDCIRSRFACIIDEISDQVVDRLGGPDCVSEIIVDSPPELLGIFLEQLHRRWPQAELFSNCFENDSTGKLNSVMTAMLGMLTVDQLAASIPDITGAQTQRILGRFTPGTPSNWRQLLREMADYQPPAMRLRDAI